MGELQQRRKGRTYQPITNSMDETNTPSTSFSLNAEDGKRILKGAGVAVAGALVVYASTTIPQVDFGPWTPIVTAVAAVRQNSAGGLDEHVGSGALSLLRLRRRRCWRRGDARSRGRPCHG